MGDKSQKDKNKVGETLWSAGFCVLATEHRAVGEQVGPEILVARSANWR